jgi:uncharacterized protein involved in outer membrane biogenesis
MTDDDARPWTRRLRRVVTGVPFLVTAAVIVLLFAAYTLAGFFLVPRLIMSYAPRYVQEQLKRRAEIGEVRVNPLLFKLEIKHFRLQEADGRPLLGFDRLFVDFELSSLFRRAWTFAEIQLEAPRVDVVMARDGGLNVADLLDAFPKSEPPTKPAPATPSRVLLHHARVSGGVLSFTDLSGRKPQTATVTPIEVELHNITTLRDRRGPYAISATLTGGGVVDWEGEVSLIPLASIGHVGLRGFPLATAWRFVQDDVALAAPGGRLDAKTRYEFAYRDGTTSLKVDGVDVTVASLVLTERDGTAPVLALERIRLAGARGDLISRELTVPEIAVSRGRLVAAIARDGTVNWQHLMVAPAAPAASTPPPAAAPPTAAPQERAWRVAIDKVRVEQVALSVADRSHAAALDFDVGDLAVELSAKLESGSAGLTGTVQDLGVKVARVTMAEATAAKTQLLSLDQIALEGGRVDLGARHIAATRVAVTGGATTAVRAADGSIPLAAMFGPADQGKPTPGPGSAPARSTPAPASKPWTLALEKFDAGDHRVAVTDRSVTPNVQLELTGVTVSARDLRSDGKKPILFETAFRVTQGGRFTAKGQVAPDGSRAEATVNVARLALRPAQPYVASHADVEVRSGEASTAGRFTFVQGAPQGRTPNPSAHGAPPQRTNPSRAGRDRPIVTYTGSADVNGVNVVEAASGDPVVVWKSMHIDTLRFGLAPDRLQVGEVRLTGLDGKLTVEKDKSLSVAKLMKPANASASAAPTSAPPPASAPPAASAQPATADSAAAPGFPVVVERVRIEDGSMNFADLSLVLPFATRVHALNGVVAGLGSDPDSRATVKLDGRVDEFGLVKVDGALTAFRPKVFTDINVAFRNVPMPTLTPYSVTFAGRRIAAGTMDVDLQYKIDRGALVGENKVVLTKLQLGERVESPGAMRLPLDLAIAILSDSEGRISIALPVRGNVDSPEFSYGQVIWQAFVTVITRIVTSPFRALAGLFGGEAEAERLQTVVFEPGSDVVRPPEREKLQRVADLLDKRTQLKVIVHGGYEAKVDGEALRSLHVRQDLAKRLEATVKPGEDPGPVAFDQAKTQRALEAMLKDRAGDKAVEEFQAGFEKSAGRKAERANPVLALVGRGSPDRGFYEALFKRLVETAPLADDEVTSLGQRRGEATARALKERAEAAAARVEVGGTEAARTDRNAVPTRLELGAVGA